MRLAMYEEPGAAVAILKTEPPEASVLLIRRAINENDPWSGHWSFPGGRRDAGDKDLLDTALRELAEECGILLGRADLYEVLPPLTAGRRFGREIGVAPFVFQVSSRLSIRLQECEASESLWLPLAEIADPGRHRWQPVPGLPDNMLFPSINLNGTPLWGFTYRVLCRWTGVPVPEE